MLECALRRPTGERWPIFFATSDGRCISVKLRPSWRLISTILVCNVIAVVLISFEGFLTLRYAPWGRLAVDLSRLSSAQLAMKYGDPAALLRRGLLLNLWVFGPAIAMIVGLVAGLIYRRADWWVSVMSSLVLILVCSTPTSIDTAGAALLYIFITWLGMGLVCAKRQTKAPPVSA